MTAIYIAVPNVWKHKTEKNHWSMTIVEYHQISLIRFQSMGISLHDLAFHLLTFPSISFFQKGRSSTETIFSRMMRILPGFLPDFILLNSNHSQQMFLKLFFFFGPCRRLKDSALAPKDPSSKIKDICEAHTQSKAILCNSIFWPFDLSKVFCKRLNGHILSDLSIHYMSGCQFWPLLSSTTQSQNLQNDLVITVLPPISLTLLKF